MSNERFLSVASLWEIAIKVGIGKLPLAQPIDIFIPEQMRRNAIDLLPIAPEHTFRVTTLPQYHRDPFDRLLAAQSLAEGMPLLSGDTAFNA